MKLMEIDLKLQSHTWLQVEINDFSQLEFVIF